jgi:superfamily II DNA/RNA helicase
MYNRTNVRQSRTNTGWNKGPQNNFRRTRSRFTGERIDINRFISKVQAAKPVEIFRPKYAFDDFAISTALKRAIANRGFDTPTPIQDKAIPAIIAGHDIIGLADTGTGKTAAFLIPMIQKILTNHENKVLIVVPTRELALQIQEEFLALARRLSIFSVVVVGGANIRPQIQQLRSRHNVVIGTPGRIKDLLSRKVLNLSGFNNVILDEADRMLDMGFINDVRLLLSLVSPKRQTMLFSATFSSEIEKLTNQFLTNPERIAIKSGETAALIDQDIVRITGGKDKVEVLHDLLNQAQFEKVLVFTRTKHGADKLSKNLHARGFKSESIHGDKPHAKRQKALKMFKDNVIEILVATDVAARGLDIPNVSHVINFDLPATYDDYVHRIGRTGRADQKGIALTFV